MINIRQISKNLIFSDKYGIWYSKDKQSVSYPNGGNSVCFDIEESSYWYLHRNICIAEAVKRYHPGSQIFDIGGGNGIVSKELQRLGLEVCLIEPGADGALNAINQGINNVVCSTLEDSGLAENTIPAAGIFDVLEHCENDIAFLKLLHYLLIPKGRLFLTVPAFSFLWSENDRQVGHFRRYSKDELRQKLESVGFVVDYATYYFAWLLVPLFFLRTLPFRLRIHRDVNSQTKRKEHMVKNKLLKPCASWILKREIINIRRGRPIKFGTSCLFVTHKR